MTPQGQEWYDGIPQDAKDWYDSRPQIIKDMMDKQPPNHAYRIKDTDIPQHCLIFSANEDGTFRVVRWFTHDLESELSLAVVFGVHPDNLEMIEEKVWVHGLAHKLMDQLREGR